MKVKSEDLKPSTDDVVIGNEDVSPSLQSPKKKKHADDAGKGRLPKNEPSNDNGDFHEIAGHDSDFSARNAKQLGLTAGKDGMKSSNSSDKKPIKGGKKQKIAPAALDETGRPLDEPSKV